MNRLIIFLIAFTVFWLVAIGGTLYVNQLIHPNDKLEQGSWDL